jgi:hypothetical protein
VNTFFLPVAKKKFPQDDNNTVNNNSGTRGTKVKHSSTINSNPSHHLTYGLNNQSLNKQLKFLTMKETESIIKSLKPKNTCEYDEISTKLLKMSSAFITSPL